MFSWHSSQVEIELVVLKEPRGTRHCITCDERRFNELLRTSWKSSYILVTGLPGIGKTWLCEKLTRELINSQESNVYKYDSIEELRKNERRHFNSYGNHNIVLVDNVTYSQLDGRRSGDAPNTTIIFSRTLLMDQFDCVVKIKGSQRIPSWDDYSSWNNHINVLCSIPFLLVLFDTLFSKSVLRHNIYYLLLTTYINYCQTLQVSLFTAIEEVPVKVKNFLKDIAYVTYSCLSKKDEFIDEIQLRKFCNIQDEMGVVTQVDDKNWRFTFEGSADCLTAFMLFWINEEQFDKDTPPAGNIKVPHEAMRLYKGV